MNWKHAKTFSYGLMVLAGSLFSGGCGLDSLSSSSSDIAEKESNDTFDEAQAVNADTAGSVGISGSLSSSDCDVFLLGSFTEGETITVRLRSSSSLLSSDTVSVGIFDGNQDVAWLEQDVDCKSTYQDVLTYTVCEDSHFYLALCRSDSSRGTLSYELQVNIGSGSVTVPDGQIVYFNFNGISSLDIGGVSMSNLAPFSEINMGYSYELLAKDIINLVKEDYSGYQVTFISSYDQSAPSDAYSTVYITSSKGDYYGLADDVDWYDEDKSDNAVVFAGLMVDSGITRTKFDQMVANVVSHETGHLLGLMHTDDDTELMDQSTPTSALEEDQSFGRAPLAAEEFPIGYQDALELLAFSIGK